MGVVGVLLAAGRGERFGGDKLLTELREGAERAPIAIIAVRRLRRALTEVVAVVSPGNARLARLLEHEGATVVVAQRAHEGMGESLAAGVAASPIRSGYVVALADMPWIEPATITRIVQAIENGASLAAPRYRGQRGHPVGFSSAHRNALLRLSGDEGARAILAAHRDALVLIDVDDAGVLRDVDTRSDLDDP